MKSVIRRLLFAIAFGFVGPAALFGQTYCPQALMGQMNGSWYYNCQVCAASTCTMMHVATASSYDCGGCCDGCCGGAAANCIDPISGLSKGPMPTQAAGTARVTDNGDDAFDVLFLTKQTAFADFAKAGFKGPGKHINITRYKVQVDIAGKGRHYFYCIEAVHNDYKDQPLRFGQELDGDTPIPDTLAVTSLSLERSKGAGHYHRLKKSENFHFDVTSVNDLGTTP